MSIVDQGENSESNGKDDALTPDQAFEAWKHYANAGGVDKNTMVAS